MVLPHVKILSDVTIWKMKDAIERSKANASTTLLLDNINYKNDSSLETILNALERIAFITAIRLCRKKVVSVSVDTIEYQKPTHIESIFEVVGEVVSFTNPIVHVRVAIHAEHVHANVRSERGSAHFSVVVHDEVQIDSATQSLLPIKQEQFVGGEMELRKMLNARLSPKTIGRATLYNYLVKLRLRENTIYNKRLCPGRGLHRKFKVQNAPASTKKTANVRDFFPFFCNLITSGISNFINEYETLFRDPRTYSS